MNTNYFNGVKEFALAYVNTFYEINHPDISKEDWEEFFHYLRLILNKLPVNVDEIMFHVEQGAKIYE